MPSVDDEFEDLSTLDDVVGSLEAVRRGRERRSRTVFAEDMAQPPEVLAHRSRTVFAEPSEPEESSAPSAGPPRVRRARSTPTGPPASPRSAQLLTAGFVAFLVGALVAIGLLSAWAVQAIRNSADGDVITVVQKSPGEPGFQALLAPTPSLALFQAEGDTLHAVSVIALAGNDGNDGGAVMFVPPATLVPAADGSVTTLTDVYRSGGIVAAEAALARTLDVGFVEAAAFDDALLAELVTGAGPLELRLADPLVNAEGTVLGAGELALDPAQVAAYLGFLNPGEAEVNLAVREEVFWEAYLAALRNGGTAAGDDVFVRFVEGLASGPVEYHRLPSAAASGPTGTVYEPDDRATRTLALELMPFPVEAFPGARPRVRLLDGVGDQAQFFAVARSLVAVGAQVSVIGNADTLEEPETTITYLHADNELPSQAFVFSLGTGRVIADVQAVIPEGLGYDITVVIGRDLRLPGDDG